jgi:phosphate transport system substrate-binding protein
MMLSNRLRGGLALAGCAAATAAAPGAAAAKPVITMSGSTSVAPLAAALAHGFLAQHHGFATFRLLQGGSNVGISDVAHGRVTIGNSSRDPQPSDPGGLSFNKIARDAICLSTNRSNRLGNLSQSQIRAIFSGQVSDWSQVAGASVSGPIDLVARTAASGTHDAFQKIFMGSTNVSSSAKQKSSNGLVRQVVASDPRAIGYMSQDFIGGLNPVAYNGVSCNLRNAKSGQYTGARNFWMVTLGPPRGAAATWIHWIRTNNRAARIVATHWVPLF